MARQRGADRSARSQMSSSSRVVRRKGKPRDSQIRASAWPSVPVAPVIKSGRPCDRSIALVSLPGIESLRPPPPAGLGENRMRGFHGSGDRGGRAPDGGEPRRIGTGVERARIIDAVAAG